MKSAFEFLALCSCGLFAGAALYINLVEHPARMSCDVAVALTEFRPSYKRATVMQASLAAVSLVTGIAAWRGGSRLELAYRVSADRRGHTIYFDCDFADESQIARQHT
jgi:hypothetical protein